MEFPHEEYIKCIRCGEINIVNESRKILESEVKEKWSTWVIPTVQRKLKEICARKGLDINDCFLYFAALDAREQAGMIKQEFETGFGVPGTGK